MSDYTNITGTTEYNSMQAVMAVVPPQHKSFSLLPVKDAFISKRDNVFNFGIGDQLMIKYHSTDENKTLVAFDVPAIDPVDTKNIDYAKLKFCIVGGQARRNAQFVLKLNNSTTWSETGVTWLNQPFAEDIVSTASVSIGDTFLEFNLIDLLKTNTEDKSYSFTIEEVSSFDSNSSVFLSSRESSSHPVLEYSYLYYPDSCNLVDLGGSFIVRRKAYEDLNGAIKVKGGLARTDIDGNLVVKKYDNHEDLDGVIAVNARKTIDITGDITIKPVKETKDFDGNIIVVQKKSAYIDGSLTIKPVNTTNDLDGAIVSRAMKTKDIAGSLRIMKNGTARDISGKITVRKNTNKDLQGSLSVSKYGKFTEIDGELTVAQKRFVDLEGSLSVNQYNNNKDIDGSIDVSFRSDIEGSLVVVKNDNAEITGTMTSRPKYGKDLDGSIKVTQTQGSYSFIM